MFCVQPRCAQVGCHGDQVARVRPLSPHKGTTCLQSKVRGESPGFHRSEVVSLKVTIKREGQCVEVSDGRWVEMKEERCCLTVPAVCFQEDNSSCLPLAWSFPWDFAMQVAGPNLCSNSPA